ncbi:MAG: hypothetical protein C0602_04395 [Denitrovibrio sp.]|nr:MAG: hypothetical protein C0602_04395 [Denitrovibrio sp.]
MKYISLILFVTIFAFSCGKKTDPVAKDSLERASRPENFTVSATDNGVLIANSEDMYLLVEKAVVKDEVCSEYSKLKIIDPKETFLDKDVSEGNVYNYRLTAKTINYGMVSDSVVKQVTYSKPPKVISAELERNSDILHIKVTTSEPFLRMDLFSGDKSIIQTGKNTMTAPLESLSSRLSIVLTDKFGNKGPAYSIDLTSEQTLPENQPVKGLSAVKFDNELRIFWDSSKATGYEVQVCENDSCETFETALTYTVYQKEFDNCLSIIVYATGGGARSEASSIRFCK